MRYVTFQKADGTREVGVVSGNQVQGTGVSDMVTAIGSLPSGKGAAMPLSSVKLLAPIPRPGKLICIGLNYRDHAIETNMAIPTVPTVFAKFTTSVIAAGDSIVLPKNSEKPDYEAEFAFVIGKKARNVKAADWKEYVFGYTIVNDVSARDVQMATSQWILGKSFDTFCPMGPAILTADEMPDPTKMRLTTSVNGEKRQDASVTDLIFDIPTLIETLSAGITLEPGDLIATGTPAGVGLGFTPPRFLKKGDVVTIEVSGIGKLENPVG